MSSKLSTIIPKSGEATYTSRDVRKIDNGFVVRDTVHGPNGYNSTETFNEDHPSMTPGADTAGGSSLKAAIQCIDKPYISKK